MTQIQINAKSDRTELAYARSVYKAAEAAWLIRGSDRNIDALYAAEMRYFQVRDAIKRGQK